MHKQRPRSFTARFARALNVCLVVGLWGVSLSSLGARWGWLCELTTHFRVQYMTLAAVACLLGWLHRRRLWTFLPAAIFLWHAFVVAPCFVPRFQQPEAASSDVTRIVSINVHCQNRTDMALEDFLRESDPHVVAIQECTPFWRNVMQGLSDVFPHQHFVVREDAFGLGIISRIPLTKVRTVQLPGRIPLLLAEGKVSGQSVTIVAAHLFPPRDDSHGMLRNQQFQKLADIVRQIDHEVILVGDLNCTPFSPYFQDFLRDSRLKDSRTGTGIQPTWPSDLFWLRIPIDHGLVSEGVQVIDLNVGSSIRSDHFPVILDLHIPERAP